MVKIDFSKLRQFQLTEDSDIKPFKCADSDLNEIYSGQGLGTFIFDNIKYAFSNVKRLGCRFITVDALKTAVPFYERNGFRFITESDKDDETRLMFFDLKNFVA